MAKYYGKIGFVRTVETAPSVWREKPIERNYYGDDDQRIRRFQFQAEGVNDDIVLGNQISIVADPYARQNCPYIKYCWYNGVPWKVESITVEYPRILLSLGGVYNGQTVTPRQGTEESE